MTIEKAYKQKMKNRVKQLFIINKKPDNRHNQNSVAILNSICGLYNKEVEIMLNGISLENYLDDLERKQLKLRL
jgi:Ni,Fe-hydrogenase I cytochrome b subunit